MADLPSPARLVANGEYALPHLVPGKEYLMTLKGTFDTATVKLEVYNDALGEFHDIDDGSWTAITDQRIIFPSRNAQLVVSGITGVADIAFTLIPIL